MKEKTDCVVKNKVIDIVLPAYNPPIGWEQKVVGHYNKLHELWSGFTFNFYIVTDGSVRGYEKEVVDFLKDNIKSLKVVDYEKNMGKGYALRSAVRECNSNYVIYIDYDFPYTWDSVKNVITALEDGADVVVAVRDNCYQKALPRFRKILSYSSHFFNKVILRLKITDTQGGMKGFSSKGRDIFLTTTINSFLFDTQFIYKATHKNGIKVVSVNAKIKEGVKVSVMGFKVLKREIMNAFVILSNK